MLNYFKRFWDDRRGSGVILAIGLAILLFVIAAFAIESSRMDSMAEKVRSEVQAATVECCAEQYADIYNGIREGYSGGYSVSNGRWNESLSPADVYARINADAGTRQEGDSVVKYAGSSVDYRLSDLSAQITNAPFAPSGTDSGQFTCTAEIDIEVPLIFNWQGVPSMHNRIKVTSGYTPKF